MNGLAASAEIVTAGTALAGLVLIYIGTLVTSYGSYAATEQRTVKGRFQTRAWLAFVGLTLALLSAALAVIAEAFASPCAGNAAVVAVLCAFGWALFVTVANVREIK